MLKKLIHYEKSDAGLLRQNNEDHFIVFDQYSREYDLQQLGMIFVIADGMGGHLAGEVASRMACEEVVAAYYGKYFNIPDDAEDGEWQMDKLEKAIWAAHKKLINFAAEQKELRGMGTTLSALVLANDKALIAHVGDSRIYRYRNNFCERVTVDHTKNQAMIDTGQILPDREKNHFCSHIITQALGGYNDLDAVFTRLDDVQDGDVFLLSTDGLHDLVTDREIQEILMNNPVPQSACDALVQAAINKGGHDNITVIVVKI
ncbi:MAG: protein phosphatase 2C domain-containing protein [Syntrophales bacterium]